MEYGILALTLLAVLLITLLLGKLQYLKWYKNNVHIMKEEYGNLPSTQYELNELDNIKKMFYRFSNENSLDDITSSDLEIDDIFKRVNYSKSTIGASYLYYLLRNPQTDINVLHNFDSKVSLFTDNEDERLKLRSNFFKIGKLRTDLFDCLDIIGSLEKRSLIRDYLALFFVFAGICLCFFSTSIGIALLIASLIFNILTYYSERGKIEPYIITFSYINRFISIAKDMSHSNDSKIVADEFSEANNYIDNLKAFTRRAGMVVNKNNNTGTGNPLEIFVDYIKMFFHIDVIYFYKMLEALQNNIDSVINLYMILGKIESYISIAYYRASLNNWCRPKLSENLVINDAYHPLIDKPVVNSIVTDKCVLVTGSNASGKSTFLKTVAVNAVLSQTIYTCCCSGYSGQLYSIFSSMSLRDNLSGQDSYFMVEIKAMKRILDYKEKNPNRKILCFVDEVLRGTNTVERISASSEILCYLSEIGCICFAATHDGELTYLLENVYDNYHFQEEIKDNDVLFNYTLYKGRAMTRNAIKLLDVMGFPSNIVKNAENRANTFIEKGEWK